jgi:hypothetical protein
VGGRRGGRDLRDLLHGPFEAITLVTREQKRDAHGTAKERPAAAEADRRTPEKPPSKVSSAIFLLVFVVGGFLATLSWWGGTLLLSPVNSAAYRPW